jgi:hypothetical protein
MAASSIPVQRLDCKQHPIDGFHAREAQAHHQRSQSSRGLAARYDAFVRRSAVVAAAPDVRGHDGTAATHAGLARSAAC